jgi:hypothetical protein
MVAFREWLLWEERQVVDPAVLAGYDYAFNAELEKLIQRTRNLPLRRTLEGMRDCPVRTKSGRCTGWADYILGGLLRHCPKKVDPEQGLNHIAFRMLSSVGEGGQPKKNLFDFDTERIYDLERGNPLEARFKTFLINDLRNICAGRIRRITQTQRSPGTVSITPARRRGDEPPGYIPAEQIPGPSDAGEHEMLADIVDLLRSQSTPQMPLAALFQAILDGIGTREQRRRFGRNTTDQGRKIIYDTLVQYAKTTGNLHLQNLLTKFKDFDARKPDAPKKPKPPKPLLALPPQERAFRSMIQVMERYGRRASMAVFGSQRSRWLERPSTDPAHKTRLHQVLDQMVKAGVLAKQGAVYVPGANYEEYLTPV